MECFDTALFCRYIDDELDGQERADALTHLLTCEDCAAQLQILEHYDTTLRSVLPMLPAPEVPTCTRYTDADRSAYVSKVMTAPEAAAFEQHLQTCDVCVGDVLAIHRTLRLLQREPLLTPLAPLVTAVHRMPAPAAPREYLGAVIIQVAPEGLTFVDARALPVHTRLTVGGHLLPAGALRNAPSDAQAAALLDIRQSTGDLDLHISALHEEKATVRLTIHVQKRGTPLALERISLYRDGHLQYSSKTSAHGGATFTRLIPGEYTIRLGQAHVEMQCILRTVSGTMPSV